MSLKGTVQLNWHLFVLQAVVAMLACARLGAVHSVVFGGFAARELARRIEHAEVSEGGLTGIRLGKLTHFCLTD